MKRSLADWASLAEIIGAGAIVVSLIFVGLEIRNSARQTELNTQAIQLSAYQVLVGQINDMSLLNIDHPELVASFSLPYDEMEPSQQQQQLASMVMRARHADLAYYQYSLGMLDDERLRSVMGPLTTVWCSEPFTRIWRGAVGQRAAADFKAYLDAEIAQNCSSGDL